MGHITFAFQLRLIEGGAPTVLYADIAVRDAVVLLCCYAAVRHSASHNLAHWLHYSEKLAKRLG